MKTSSFYIIATAVTIALAALPALADYHYASHTGSNEYPYTSWATAADSIQKAIDAATAGDTIYVGVGVWEEQDVHIDSAKSLIGQGPDSTILRKDVPVIYFRPNHDSLIKGFKFDGLSSDQHTAIGVHAGSQNVTITDCVFDKCMRGIGVAFRGQIINNLFIGTGIQYRHEVGIDAWVVPNYLLVKNNTFSSFAGDAIEATDGQWIITNNIFHHNPDAADIMVMLNFGNHGPLDTCYFANNIVYRNYHDETLPDWEVIQAGPGVRLENNTIVGLGADDRFTGIWTFRSKSIINNTISDFRYGIDSYGNQIPIHYNNFWDNIYDIQYNDSIIDTVGNIHADPMFTDTNMFQLQLYSPLIDAGDPNILDLDGTRSDIGAYGGPYGQSYQYLDLPPTIPESLRVDIGDDSLLIRWQYNTESDFDRYYLFKDTIMGFTPSFFNLIAMPDTSLYIDRDFDRLHNYYYRITGIDFQGNMSYPSQELGVRFVGIDNWGNPTLPTVTEIKSTYPNPFNSMITIGYFLADIGYQPAEVKLYIYDIGGRLVRKLVDCRQNPGRYTVTWDGKTDGGEQLSSGVYFSRLSVSGIELQKPRKITLMK
jgi:hypothetical protein